MPHGQGGTITAMQETPMAQCERLGVALAEIQRVLSNNNVDLAGLRNRLFGDPGNYPKDSKDREQISGVMGQYLDQAEQIHRALDQQACLIDELQKL